MPLFIYYENEHTLTVLLFSFVGSIGHGSIDALQLDPTGSLQWELNKFRSQIGILEITEILLLGLILVVCSFFPS